MKISILSITIIVLFLTCLGYSSDSNFIGGENSGSGSNDGGLGGTDSGVKETLSMPISEVFDGGP